jgi:ribose-phosphate pyrophosphokinase
MRKERRSDRVVEVSAPDMTAYRQHTPVVVDDVVSSAQTMVETVTCLVGAGLRAPVCVAVHALFSGTSEQALRDAGAVTIVTTTSVPHSTNRIDVVPLMIPHIRDLAEA